MSKKFGIDLGTTNSCISIYLNKHTAKAIKLDSGKTTMPSCVMWLGGDNWVVGEEAYKNRFRENACYSIKTHMGEDYKHEFRYNGESCIKTPTEISAMILKELAKRAHYLYPEIKDVTITVPAGFLNEARKATKEAGVMAGFNVVAIINEPTSAALCYENSEDKEVLIYDLGGGTFDVSVLHIETLKKEDLNSDSLNFEMLGVSLEDENNSTSSSDKKTYEVLASEGDRHLGGDNIDLEWFNIMCAKFNKTYHLYGDDIVQNQLSIEEQESIILRLEEYKKYFADKADGRIEINNTIGLDLTTTRADLVEATKKIYNKTRLSVNKALANKKVNRKNIKDIILVGGSTKSEIIYNFLKRDFPQCKISRELNPDEAVAIGASIQTAINAGETNSSILDVSPYTISVGVINTNSNNVSVQGRTLPIVRKNTVLPVCETQTFNVNKNGNKLSVPLYVGESVLACECQKIGDIIVERESQDTTADLNILIDSNGMFTLKITSGGITKEVEVVNILGINQSAKVNNAYTRLTNRWRAQLEAHNVKFTKKLIAAFEKFEKNGDAESRAYIQKQMQKASEEISREKTNIFKREDPNESVDSEE